MSERSKRMKRAKEVLAPLNVTQVMPLLQMAEHALSQKGFAEKNNASRIYANQLHDKIIPWIEEVLNDYLKG